MDRALMTICDRRYLPGAVALLKSTHRHHPDVSLYCFVPEEDVEIARSTLGDLAEVRVPSRQIRGVPKSLQAMEAKLLACQLDHEAVAVVDADVVLCAPGPELWDIEPGRIRAVADGFETLLDSVPPELRADFSARHPHLCGLRPFNAGVIGLRPRDWPSLLEDFESELSSYQYNSYNIMFDQIFLNVLMLESCRFLPETYNVRIISQESIPATVSGAAFLLHAQALDTELFSMAS